jgi:hypothetical protein
MNEKKEKYLGDGLYARYENGMIGLRAPRAGGDHECFLEPAVLYKFFSFVAEVKDLHIVVSRKDGWVTECGTPKQKGDTE